MTRARLHAKLGRTSEGSQPSHSVTLAPTFSGVQRRQLAAVLTELSPQAPGVTIDGSVWSGEVVTAVQDEGPISLLVLLGRPAPRFLQRDRRQLNGVPAEGLTNLRSHPRNSAPTRRCVLPPGTLASHVSLTRPTIVCHPVRRTARVFVPAIARLLHNRQFSSSDARRATTR